MTLRTRLAVGIAAVMLVMLLPLALSLRSIQQLRHETESLRDQEFQATSLLARARAAAQDLDQSKVNLSIIPNVVGPVFTSRIDSVRIWVDSLGTLTRTPIVPRMRSTLDAIRQETKVTVDHANAG